MSKFSLLCFMDIC